MTRRRNGCSATYRKFEGYKRQGRRHHIDYIGIDILLFDHFDAEHVHFQSQNAEPEEEGIPNSINNENCNERVNETGYEHSINQESESIATETQIDLQKKSALFLLKTKEVNQLTQKAIDSLVSDTTNMVKTTFEVLKMK